MRTKKKKKKTVGRFQGIWRLGLRTILSTEVNQSTASFTRHRNSCEKSGRLALRIGIITALDCTNLETEGNVLRLQGSRH